jgi:hypothetical protein
MTTKITDEKVLKLFEALQVKKQLVEKALKPSYPCGGFKYSDSEPSRLFDISTIRDERKLIEIGSFLKLRETVYNETAQELGSSEKYTWLGFTKDEWFADLKTRMNVLQISERKRELFELESRLNSLISPELKAQMELEEIEKLLNK